MRKKFLSLVFLFILFSMGSSLIYGQVFPGKDWSQMENPCKKGWDSVQLSYLKKFIIDSSFITGFMIVQQGQIVFEFGDIGEVSYIASCRKSVLSILYGAFVKTGIIKLERSLKELKIDDVGGLLESEKEATVQDIISSRSGVFHTASYTGDYLYLAPERGSVKHGEYWLYSNWDFNVAGHVFEKQTGHTIYDEVERQLAYPLQMQDWDRLVQHKEGDSSLSVYPAYPMWFSTRDMARIGLLMLRKGQWSGKQLIDPHWMKEMLRPRTSYTELNAHVPDFAKLPYKLGYGYMWWLWQDVNDSRLSGGYSALGSMGQTISVFPATDIVIAFKTKSVYERATTLEARLRALELAVKSWQGETK